MNIIYTARDIMIFAVALGSKIEDYFSLFTMLSKL